jgi:DNA (cytosine-5)-methyltransferase 1
MNELALFAGAGGGILGGKLLGWRTVCAVEWEQYPASVLCARQNDGILPPFPIWDDVQTFDGHPWRGIVDVISGGFPCQDISAAGKGAGIEGERSGMWREMARIICEVRPKYVFVENSPMLTSRGLGRVLGDLAAMGFDARWGVLGANDIGANHKRDRIWIVAQRSGHFSHTQHDRIRRWEQQSQSITQKTGTLANPNCITGGSLEVRRSSVDGSKECGDLRGVLAFDSGNEQKETREILANSTNIGQQRQGKFEQSVCSKESGNWKTNLLESIGRPKFWSVEPNVGRVADGVAARMDRLKAIGNGQVPLCAATAWRILNDF